MPGYNPVSSSSISTFAPQITSVGGGGQGSLEAVPTVGLTTPALRTFYNVATDRLESWLLYATATDFTANPPPVGVQLPNDYNAATNAKAWFHK